MSTRSADTVERIRSFQTEARECAVQMMMNALFIQQELPNVRMENELRQRTVDLCSALIGTKHDLVHEIFELDELLEQEASNDALRARIDRMERWAQEDAVQMHEIVLALDEAAKGDILKSGAYILVSESAVNILKPLARMRKLAAALRSELV
jgi:hypothetical protein